MQISNTEHRILNTEVSCSCHAADAPPTSLKFRKIIRWVRCLLPGTMLVLVPKCPLCIMAYAGMFTGLGISFATASYLRVAMIVVSVTLPVYLVGRQYIKLRRNH